MRIGELSRRTGVPVPTIKYYVREGLLPAGELTSPNQASYDDRHERRLRLIRALLDIGGLSVAAIREVVAAVDDPGRSVHKVLGEAAHRITPRYARGGDDASLARARDEVGRLIARRGWQVDVGDPAATALCETLAALDRVGHGAFAEVLDDLRGVKVLELESFDIGGSRVGPGIDQFEDIDDQRNVRHYCGDNKAAGPRIGNGFNPRWRGRLSHLLRLRLSGLARFLRLTSGLRRGRRLRRGDHGRRPGRRLWAERLPLIEDRFEKLARRRDIRILKRELPEDHRLIAVVHIFENDFDFVEQFVGPREDDVAGIRVNKNRRYAVIISWYSHGLPASG